MKEYRYELRKGSKHDECPNCKKTTFKPYIDKKTNKEAGNIYGVCERINQCGQAKLSLVPNQKSSRSKLKLTLD